MKRANLKKLNDAYTNKFGFAMPEKFCFEFCFGLSTKIIADISASKNEPTWMREFRQKSLQIFKKMKMPIGGKFSKNRL
jgi:Fe-S cluster assembly protein SufB